MKDRLRRYGIERPLVECYRGLIGEHRGRIVETVDPWIGLVNRSRPTPCTRSRAGGNRHRGTGAGRPDTRQVEQIERSCEIEPHQPGIGDSTVYDPGLLKDLDQAGRTGECSVEDAPFLRPGWRLMVVKAAPSGSERAEGVPEGRMAATAKVDPPEPCSGRQRPGLRRDSGQPFRRRWFRKLGHPSVRGRPPAPPRPMACDRGAASRVD